MPKTFFYEECKAKRLPHYRFPGTGLRRDGPIRLDPEEVDLYLERYKVTPDQCISSSNRRRA